MLDFITKRGDKVEFVRELGRGGEGVVYQIKEYVEREGDIVAKLYHKQNLPDAAKQAKLQHMAKTRDANLLRHAAWPLATLHLKMDGPVYGFLMPNAAGRHPVHEIYTPRDRRRILPDKGWDFLLHVARNTAAAFDTVHRHGHVVGDVNQNNLRVGNDGTVMLVDTDSFQVNVNGTLHLCGVASPHFTPPELQTGVSFEKIPRTANNDNFGLAVLLFHLLFCGRHPYMGIPRAKAGLNKVDTPLETHIRSFRYAHASDGALRNCQPPLGAIPMDLVPEPVQKMFHTAFTEDGVRGRPTAAEWMGKLESLAGRLYQCPKARVHVYDKSFKNCPWCEMQNGYNIAYFGPLPVKPANRKNSDTHLPQPASSQLGWEQWTSGSSNRTALKMPHTSLSVVEKVVGIIVIVITIFFILYFVGVLW